ncbi:MAG: hypothetical protein ABJH81_11615 [Balneola sp.]
MEIKIGKDSHPVDFGKYISNLLGCLLRKYSKKEKLNGGIDTLIKDIELQDFNDIKEKLNSGYIHQHDQFIYLLVKSFHYSNTFEAIDRGSKINEYFNQLEESLLDNKLMKDMISLIHLALINSIMQVMYAVTYVIMNKEHSKMEYENRMADALNQSKNSGTLAQLLGGATYLASDSERIKNLGMAGIAFGFYNNYSNSKKVNNSFHSEYEQINDSLIKSYTDILSHLVTGAQIATRLFATQIDDVDLNNLVSKMLEKWTRCCRFCLSTSEFKGFLVEHFLINKNDDRIKKLVTSKFSYITDATDLDENDFSSYPNDYVASKQLLFKMKAIPWVMLAFAIASIFALSLSLFLGFVVLIIVFGFLGGYFRLKKDYQNHWLNQSLKFDETINSKKFFRI